MAIYKFLKRLNTIASIVVAILAVYIVIRPSLPNVILALSVNQFDGYVFQSNKSIEKLGDKAWELPQIPETNRIVVPKIYVNAPITEGFNESALDLGMWHRPNTSTPNKGGNTVITAHRFLNTSGPETFYHLDKIIMDDLILVYWEGREYAYKVYEITTVNPNQIEVEFNTLEPILTLYTCTPLWTSEQRLVVKARLQQ